MPTVVITENTSGGTHTGVLDTYIYSVNATTNYGSSGTLQVQNNGFAYAEQSRALFRFTLPAALNGATISAVRFRLYRSDGGGTGWTVDVHELLRAFNVSQATYNIYSTGNNWATAGATGSGDLSASAAASAVISGGGGAYIEWSGSGLVSLLQAAATASAASIDLIAKPQLLDSGASAYAVFTASDGTDGQRPVLEVDYTAAASGAAQEETVSLAETIAGIASTDQAQAESVSAAETITASITAGVQGSIISEPLKRNNGTLASDAALDYVALYDQNTHQLVLLKTGLSTNSLGVFAFTDPAAIQGVDYLLDWKESTGERRMPLKAAE